MTLTQPPQWSAEQLESDSTLAQAEFREMRMQEPLEQYLDSFEIYRESVEELIESTVDLSQLAEQAVELLSQPETLTSIRYLASPAISEDDLKVIAEAVLSPSRIRGDEAMAKRIIDTILLGLDRNRFPWVSEEREPTDTERSVAVISTAALIASQKVQTARRTDAKKNQEGRVADFLISQGFTQVGTRSIANYADLPQPGEFCGESMFGSRKADLVVRIWDGRAMPIECKVSNSSTNSIKRINNDAAVKASEWIKEFGKLNVIPTAMLSGVFKVNNLISAQSAGLSIFWAHNLDALASFLGESKKQN